MKILHEAVVVVVVLALVGGVVPDVVAIKKIKSFIKDTKNRTGYLLL